MTEQCVPNDGLINPAMFPAKSVDLKIATISASAAAMRSMGKAVEDKTTSVSTTWSRLPSCYQAPEQDRVYAVMRPAVTSADALHTRFDDAARHIDTYAGALEAIKPRLADLERRATEFRNRVVNGVWVDASSAADASFMDHLGGIGDYIPGVTERQVKVSWNEDQDTVDENTRLLKEYAQILSDVSAAVATCANAINGLNTNVCTVPVETIPAEAFTSGETPMPWGYAVTENRNCRESVGQGAYTFGKDLLQGAGQLILGYNPANGDWFSGDAYGQAWGGLGDLVGSIVVLASPVGWVAAGMAVTGNNDNAFSDWMYDRAVTLRNAGGALVGWDPNAEDGWHAWKEDGVAAGTGAVLSIGTFFIPGAGQVGAGLKAGSIGARIARVTGAVSEFAIQGGSWVVKGGVKILTGLRTIAARFDLGDFGGGFGPQLAVAGAGAGVRANPFAGLLNAMTDGSRATPGTTPHTPIRDAIFGPRDTTPRLDTPRVDTPRVDTPPLTRADTPEIPRTERPGGTDTTPVRDPQNTGDGNPVRDPQNTGDGNPTRDPQDTGNGNPTRDPQDTGNGNPTRDPQDTGNGNPTRDPQDTGNGDPTRDPQTAGDGNPVRDPSTADGTDGAPARDPEGNDDTSPAGSRDPADGESEAGGGQSATDPEPSSAAGPTTPPRETWEQPTHHPRPEVEQTVVVDRTTGGLPGSQTPFARQTDLAPNTMYQVTTRTGIESNFYTDGSGKVVYVETTYGRTGALNWDLMKPQPNVTYVVHPQTNAGSGAYTHVFRTDGAGRTVAAFTDDLQRGVADRSQSIQQRVGSVGTKRYGTPYEGGHLLANMFGGGPESSNLVAMMEAVNRGKAPSFSSLERLWDESIAQGKKVEVDVSARYGQRGDKVPTHVTVKWTIDGVPDRRVFRNVP